ncbi:Putative uncharacterized protein [Lactobacillus delbrueckii subsp. lactis]|nr:Putative uncharacterized protein [Lactobacillus delbrueckii subsp. lactis]
MCSLLTTPYITFFISNVLIDKLVSSDITVVTAAALNEKKGIKTRFKIKFTEAAIRLAFNSFFSSCAGIITHSETIVLSNEKIRAIAKKRNGVTEARYFFPEIIIIISGANIIMPIDDGISIVTITLIIDPKTFLYSLKFFSQKSIASLGIVTINIEAKKGAIVPYILEATPYIPTA